MTQLCPHCLGLGYDASGQRCTCNDTPIQYVPPSTWSIALERIAKVALYLCCIAVIIGPTVIMVAYSKPDDAGCKAGQASATGAVPEAAMTCWPFPTKDRPLVPIKEQKPAYPGDMEDAPW